MTSTARARSAYPQAPSPSGPELLEVAAFSDATSWKVPPSPVTLKLPDEGVEIQSFGSDTEKEYVPFGREYDRLEAVVELVAAPSSERPQLVPSGSPLIWNVIA
jgi:hypothetical protein